MMRIAALLFAIGTLYASSAWAQAGTAGRFDGSWSTQLTCDSVPNGPAGYTFALLLQVRNGEITGQRINEQGSQLSFKGKIEADGSAKIAVEGTAGDAKYNIN